MSTKKYKLLSFSEDGTRKPCAFYLSEGGCRNGDKCKFAHVNVKEEEKLEEKSVVSSESGEVENQKPEKSADDNPFEDAVPEGVGMKRKNNRRGMNSDTPFPNPKKVAKETPPTGKKKQNQPFSTEDRVKSASSLPTGKIAAGDFRSLNLPIAEFALSSASNHAKSPVEAPLKPSSSAGKPPLPLPKSTEVGRKWLWVVEKCQTNKKFEQDYNFEKCIRDDEPIGGKTAWIKSKSFGTWCKDNPQVIAIDCEMCETEDPVSKIRNPSALCRVSIVDAITDEVLLNSLVKPEWPVVDYRTFINGISEAELANVQFTVRHCQAFMMALCSEETVIVGHAVHHDLKSMRMEHYCVADSSFLFRSSENETATVSLKDLSFGIFKKEMPKTHDSVNDARAALRCVEHYLEKDGKVEPIVRRPKDNRSAACQLFVHRIPNNVTAQHLSEMFLNNTKVVVDKVDDIDFSNGSTGKTLVTFQSSGHTNLAFWALKGDPEEDASGRLQKKVFLRGGKYIRIRKMVHEKNRRSISSNT